MKRKIKRGSFWVFFAVALSVAAGVVLYLKQVRAQCSYCIPTWNDGNMGCINTCEQQQEAEREETPPPPPRPRPKPKPKPKPEPAQEQEQGQEQESPHPDEGEQAQDWNAPPVEGHEYTEEEWRSMHGDDEGDGAPPAGEQEDPYADEDAEMAGGDGDGDGDGEGGHSGESEGGGDYWAGGDGEGDEGGGGDDTDGGGMSSEQAGEIAGGEARERVVQQGERVRREDMAAAANSMIPLQNGVPSQPPQERANTAHNLGSRVLPSRPGGDDSLRAKLSPDISGDQNRVAGKDDRKTEGDPIDIRTGEFAYDIPLIPVHDSVWGTLPLSVSYKAGMLRGAPGFAGLGANHTFAEMIVEQEGPNGERRIVYYSGEGGMVTFDRLPNAAADRLTPLGNPSPPEGWCSNNPAVEEFAGQDAPVEYFARGAPLKLTKERKVLAYRLTGARCGATWKFKYTLEAPEGSRRIFEGVMARPEDMATTNTCESTVHVLHPSARGLPAGPISREEYHRRFDANGEAFRVAEVGICDRPLSRGEEMLRQLGHLVPAGLTLVSDRHRSVIDHGTDPYIEGPMVPVVRVGRRRVDDAQRAQLPPSLRNIDYLQMHFWLVGGVEEAGQQDGRGFVAEGRGRNFHYEVQAFNYNRNIDAQLFHWLPSGIVAPLRVVEDPNLGRLDIQYEVTYRSFRQYLNYANSMQWQGYYSYEYSSCEVDNLDEEGGEECSNHEEAEGATDPEYRTDYTVYQVDTQLPKTMVMSVKRGQRVLARFQHHFKLMRDEGLEQQLSYAQNPLGPHVRNSLGIGAGRNYEPYRQVFHVTPVLQTVSYPNQNKADVTLSYVAPSTQGNCPIARDENVLDPIAPGEGLFRMNPRHSYTVRQIDLDLARGDEDGFYTWSPPGTKLVGWQPPSLASPGWAHCRDLPMGRRNLANMTSDYNGPLLLEKVNYGIQGAPTTGLRYGIAAGQAPIRDRIRLTQVRLNNDTVYIQNEYDDQGRVFRHSLGETGQISYRYNAQAQAGQNWSQETTVTTRGSIPVIYRYNGDGLLVRKIEAAMTTDYTYTAAVGGGNIGIGAGRPATIRLPSGERMEYAYNDRAHTLEIYSPVSIRQFGTNNAAVPTTYTYEPRFHKIKTMIVPSPQAVAGNPATATITYSYDYERAELNPCNGQAPKGNLVRIDYPDGKYEAWTHDKLGRVLEHRNRGGAVDRFEYRNFSENALNCQVYGRMGQ